MLAEGTYRAAVEPPTVRLDSDIRSYKNKQRMAKQLDIPEIREMDQSNKCEIEIREFRREDAGKVSCLIRKTLIEVNSKDYPQDVIRFLCENYSPQRIIEKSSNRQIYVAVDDGRILGTASLKDDIALGLFVNPEFHGKGIGTKLMSHIEVAARKRGYKSIRLPSSITAYEFYKKLGYKKVRDEYSREFGKAIIMGKSL
jgi:GNAT superfamily N-acetyltransferase